MKVNFPNKNLNISAHYNDFESKLENLDSAWAQLANYFRIKKEDFESNSNGLQNKMKFIRKLSVWKVWEQLEARRKRFEAGDTMELLHVVQLCAIEILPLPIWAALAFDKQFKKFLQPGDPISLNDVFTTKNLPKSEKRARGIRNDWKLGGKLWGDVWEASVSGKYSSLDAVLKEVLKNPEYEIGKTKARELVLMIDKNQRELLGRKKIDLIKFFRYKNK